MAHRGHQDGDGWVDCACGERHWGVVGAAGLLLFVAGRVLLQHRATWSHHGGTWGIPGGARRRTESALAAALREASEEAGVDGSQVAPVGAHRVDHGSWSYTTVVATHEALVHAEPTDPESVELRWVLVDEVERLDLHPGFAASWPEIRPLLGPAPVLVVDAANVVGSRPDGWWRDRAGATERLAGALTEQASAGFPGPSLGVEDASLWFWPRIVLVVEGQARSIPAPEGIDLRRAPSSGDDEIVRVVAELRRDDSHRRVVVASADRELGRRVRALGAAVVGPRTARPD